MIGLVVVAAWMFQRAGVGTAAPEAAAGRNAATRAPVAGVDGSAVYEIESDGLRFSYNAVMDSEVLTRVDDPTATNLAVSRPQDVERLRGMLTRKLGVPNLARLREAYAEKIAHLEALGYL